MAHAERSRHGRGLGNSPNEIDALMTPRPPIGAARRGILDAPAKREALADGFEDDFLWRPRLRPYDERETTVGLCSPPANERDGSNG
jgi:hypothetical protein